MQMLKRFHCDKCQKSLTSRQRLQSHLKRKYPCDLVCATCKIKSQNLEAYKKHIIKSCKIKFKHSKKLP